jgi:hypothetical protein
MDTDKTDTDTGAEETTPQPSTPASDAPSSEGPVEINGPKGPEPTRYGDWEQKGRCSDF